MLLNLAGDVAVIILLVLFAMIAAAIGLTWMAISALWAALRDDTKVGGRGIRRDRIKDLGAHPRSRSEDCVIRSLEAMTGRKFPTVNPAWLVWGGSQLELDGYDGDKLALEFSGPLHTKWYPNKEPYEKYFQRIVRDVAKRRICARKGVKLIVIDASLPRHQWELYLKSRLHDISAANRGSKDTDPPALPSQYIPEIVVEPYHNEQLERELGLTGEWEMVNKC